MLDKIKNQMLREVITDTKSLIANENKSNFDSAARQVTNDILQ